MRPRSVFVAATTWAAVAVMPINMVVAQMTKEWRQCSGAEGAIADVIISGCSTVIQAGQGSPKQLATALNNRGVVCDRWSNEVALTNSAAVTSVQWCPLSCTPVYWTSVGHIPSSWI